MLSIGIQVIMAAPRPRSPPVARGRGERGRLLRRGQPRAGEPGGGGGATGGPVIAMNDAELPRGCDAGEHVGHRSAGSHP
ncbi:hypothetical protein SGPA1_10415 [Streptomyces misionensis JCM 4497]